jgi:hypothetical protein
MKFLQVLLLLSLVPLVASQTRCGVTFGSSCTDPAAPCCSNYSYCGDTTAYCGTGPCQPDYSITGACGTNTSSAPPPVTPSAPGPSTTQGRCGIDPSNRSTNYGKCQFSHYCCSPFGYCGVDQLHCVGCQKDFGYCPGVCDPSKPCGALGYSTLIIAVVASLLAIATLVFECYKHFRANPRD